MIDRQPVFRGTDKVNLLIGRYTEGTAVPQMYGKIPTCFQIQSEVLSSPAEGGKYLFHLNHSIKRRYLLSSSGIAFSIFYERNIMSLMNHSLSRILRQQR